jgi:peptidoglycan/LPS O-acetylase OafA/YrhL
VSESNLGSQTASKRIAPVDGLRAVAVLGVIWAHVWLFCGNPVLSLGQFNAVNLDVHRAISMIGTGVDLFFVISGFCMYLMYAHREAKFSPHTYSNFLKKRWLRIAPAFYVAALACAVGNTLGGKPFPWFDLLAHASFTHLWFPHTGGLAAPFWSLATEWHFYLLLPLFIWGTYRWGFWSVITISILFSIGFRTWMYISPPEIEVFWKAQIPTRLIEFSWGMCVAWLYIKKFTIPKVLSAEKGFLIAFLVAYLGRLLMVSEVVHLAGSSGYLCRIAAEPILTLGYSLMLWNVITSESVFQSGLSHPVMQTLGRWSYSLYLWHWWPCLWISQLVVKHFGATPLTQYVALILSFIVLIPLSCLSYCWLEAPYFRKRHPLSTV